MKQSSYLIVFVFCLSMLAFLPPAIARKAPFYVPTAEERAHADYGEFPDNYQELVKAYMETRHNMPATARYLFIAEPSKGTNMAKSREKTIFCYTVSANINPDRSHNGYTLWTFFIKHGEIIGAFRT